MKEILIQIRPDTVSVQADNIQADTEQAKQILKKALESLENQTPKSEHKNEIVYKK